MQTPTEPIGSIPRPLRPIEAIAGMGPDARELETLYSEAIPDTLASFEETGAEGVLESR